MYLNYCNISSIDVNRPYSIGRIHMYYNPLTSIDLSTVQYLTELNVHQTHINSLDVSNNSILTDLHAYNCDSLTELDLRNGNIVNLNGAFKSSFSYNKNQKSHVFQ